MAALQRGLCAPLSAFYPGGGPWLERRLNDVRDQRALCTVVTRRGSLVATAIETPKSTRRSKLSTIWVHPAARRRGIGGRLLTHLTTSWQQRGIEEIYVTVADEVVPALLPLLCDRGFVADAIERDRYRDGHDEYVLGWRPERTIERWTKPLAA